ncbi:hypothetical protein NECID01_1123 [Nematocida sp. AWRm77]|nr:hypothetical protein NECID01_1123 [Nematocida sp. AWRm77]
MKRGAEEILCTYFQKLGLSWAIAYTACCVNFAYIFYTNMSVEIPFGCLRDPKFIFVLIIFYLFACLYLSFPKIVAQHDDLYRRVIVQKILGLLLFFDGFSVVCLLGVLVCKREAFAIVFLIPLQSIFYMETVLILLIGTIEKTAVEVYLSIHTNLLDITNRENFYMPTFELLTLVLHCAFVSAVIYMASIELFVDKYPLLSFVFQCVFAIWTQNILFSVFSAWYAVFCIIKLTTSGIQSTRKRFFNVLGRSLKFFGVFCYLGLLSIIFSGVSVLKTVTLYDSWKEQIRAPVEETMRKYFSTLYFYYMYGVESIVTISVLFDTDPKRALRKLHMLVSESEEPIIQGITHARSIRTTKMLSHFISLLILFPVMFGMHVLSMKEFSTFNFLKMGFLLLWSTYSIPALGYNYTETVHRSLLLAKVSEMPIHTPWVETHLSGFQM